jgi:hypothetical protein
MLTEGIHMRIFMTALAICTVTVANAQSAVQCNEHGAIVTISDGTVYYLGKNCDAAQKDGGTGKWWLSASAFVVDIDGQPKRLPFEVDCDLPACWLDS